REISADKAERVLGWRAGVPFAEGLRRYVDWHQARDAVPAPAVAAVAAPASAPAVAAVAAPPLAGAAPARRPPLAGALAGVRLAGATVPAARRVARRRVSWALTSVIVLTTGLTASWVGATSASADGFGSVISHGPRQVPEVAVTFDGVPDADTAREVLGALDA